MCEESGQGGERLGELFGWHGGVRLYYAIRLRIAICFLFFLFFFGQQRSTSGFKGGMNTIVVSIKPPSQAVRNARLGYSSPPTLQATPLPDRVLGYLYLPTYVLYNLCLLTTFPLPYLPYLRAARDSGL